jgi:hypothetical protein
MTMSLRRTAIAVAVISAAGAAPALAHQTAYNRGVAVTLHVNPDDEPVAGQPATIIVEKVKPPKGGKFRFSTCRCHVRVTTSSGGVVLDRAAGKRTSITFPDAAAYRIQFSGRYRKGSRYRTFSTSFAIRADRG